VKLFALALVLGCSSPAKSADPVKPAPAPYDPSCPLLVPGTSISVEDTAEGPSLVFVTTGDVDGVRSRGAALASMHNSQNGPPMALGMMFSPDSKASTSEIEGGVRVTFTPVDPSKTAAVANELRMHGSHLTGATTCEMHH
jgi:hypothetical protein